jgi:hypothetical protein
MCSGADPLRGSPQHRPSCARVPPFLTPAAQQARLCGALVRDRQQGQTARRVGRPAQHVRLWHAVRGHLRGPHGQGPAAVRAPARPVPLQGTHAHALTGALAGRYARNGVLTMLERNRMIKRAPERFRDAADKFDVIICCEERCFDQVLEGAYGGVRSLSALMDALAQPHGLSLSVCVPCCRLGLAAGGRWGTGARAQPGHQGHARGCVSRRRPDP